MPKGIYKKTIKHRKNLSKVSKGKKSNHYIDGRSLKKHCCIDCNKEIKWTTWWYGSKRCKSCSHKKIYGKKASNYKNGNHCKDKIHYCIESRCKNIVGGPNRRCKKCDAIYKSKLYQGKGNPSYINGLGKFPYPLEFNESLKKLIRNRDNRKCQLCGCPEVECLQRLDIHHIDYNKENLAKENLISLCRNCNDKVNKDRDYWFAYFTYVMENKENATIKV